MPLIAEKVQQERISDLDALHSWIMATQKNLKRIPVVGILENQAAFHDDEYFGDGHTMFRFNEAGLRSFCSMIGFRLDLLSLIETPNLASSVMNDLIRQKEILQRLNNLEFVFDEQTAVIIGIVNQSYVTYTNETFLNDIQALVNSLPDREKMGFTAGYGINTELTVRFLSETRHGRIAGRGGDGEDKTHIGLEFKNSMVGTSSVNINYFLNRLVCANGMMVPAGSAYSRVFHSGKHSTFKERLDRCFNEVFRKIDDIQTMLQSLGAIPFTPEKLAIDTNACDAIFEIVPGTKKKICETENMYLRYPEGATPEDKRKMKINHDARVIRLIPEFIGGPHSKRLFFSKLRDTLTMFDFLNVFTEQAKQEEPLKQIEIESRAGSLATYIAKHSKKFH